MRVSTLKMRLLIIFLRSGSVNAQLSLEGEIPMEDVFAQAVGAVIGYKSTISET